MLRGLREHLRRVLDAQTTFSQQVAKPRRFWRVNPIYGASTFRALREPCNTWRARRMRVERCSAMARGAHKERTSHNCLNSGRRGQKAALSLPAVLSKTLGRWTLVRYVRRWPRKASRYSGASSGATGGPLRPEDFKTGSP